MTVKNLKKLLKNLPDDLEVVIALDDDTLVSACFENSEVMGIETEEVGEEEYLLVLVPCGGHTENDVEVHEDEINLN